MSLDRALSTPDIGTDSAYRVGIDGSTETETGDPANTAPRTDRITLGQKAASRLAHGSSNSVLLFDGIEDARASIAVGTRTLFLEDGIYGLR